MKSISNLIILILTLFPLYSQNGNAIVFEEEQDNLKLRINQFENQIFLLSKNLEIINKKNLLIPKIIQNPILQLNFFYPINVKLVYSNVFIITWKSVLADKIILANYMYNLTTEEMIFKDSIHINEISTYESISYKASANNNDYFILNIRNPGSTFSNKMNLIKVDSYGKFKIMGQADKYLDPDPEKRKMFTLKFGIGLIAQSENRFLITGQVPLIFVIDSNFNLVKKFNPAFNRGMLDQVFFLDPRIRKESDTTFVAGDDFVLKDNFPESYARRYLWVNDSISPLLSNQLVNPEKLPKDLVNISTPRNDIYYVLSNVYDEYLTFKAPYTNKFYISKFVNDKQVSHWEYGGDYYYRVFDIEDIGDGKVMVVGSIFDFYKNGFYQGFYLIIDENGKVITSNIEIKTEDEYFQLLPNPAINELRIVFKEKLTKNCEINIYNVLGERILHLDIQSNKIDISSLKQGLYYFEVINGKLKKTKQFIKM